MQQPVIFLSYSHRDEAEKDQLVAHLNVLRHDGIELWVDDDIPGGDDWQRQILEHVERATVAVLLVSENSLTSDFILKSELPALQRRRESGDLKLFPIIAKPCAWRKVPWLRAMNVRPKNGEPVWGGDEALTRERLAALAEEIASLVDRRLPQTEHTELTRSRTVGGEPLTIRYDSAIYRQDFLEILRQLADGLETERMERVFGRDVLRRWSRQEEAVRARLETDFTLVVIGPFKRGKSTLVNALLGEEVVTCDIAPETVTINEIRYGPRLSIEACLADGGRVALAPEQLKREQLTPVLEKLPRQISHLDIRAPIEWLQGLCLVDTPGTGDLLQRFDRQVQQYLTRADAVLFILSPLEPFSESERAFLHLAVLPHDFAKVTFVVNMLDKIRSESDVRRVMQLLRKRTERMFPDAFLFGISAFDEAARLKGEERPKPDRALSLAASFGSLRAHLQESILHNRSLLQLDRAVAEAERLLASIESQTEQLRQALETDQARLDIAIGACEDESSALYSGMRQGHERLVATVEALADEAHAWLEAFLDRLENTARDLGSFDYEDLQCHFPFFLADSLRTATHRCLEAHRPTILGEAQRLQKDLAGQLGALTSLAETETALGKSASEATFGDALWNQLETSQVLMELTQIQVFNIAAGLIKQLEQPARKRQKSMLYQQQFLSAFPQLRRTLLEQAKAVYRSMTERLAGRLREDQRQNLETSLASFRQAQELGRSGEIDPPAQTLQKACSIAAEARGALADLQHRAWPESSEVNQDARPGIVF